MSRPFTSLSINIVFQFYHKSEHFSRQKKGSIISVVGKSTVEIMEPFLV